jgi:hypothetical protein
MPMQELREAMEKKLVQIGFKREVAVEACENFYKEHEHCSHSPTRSRLVPKTSSPKKTRTKKPKKE